MSERDRRALIWGGVLIGIAVLYRFALSPVVDQWQEARDAVASQSVMLTQYEEKLEKRSGIRKRLEQRYGPGVNRPLPTADDAQVAFPRSVQQAIGRGGAQARQVEVQGLRRLRDYPGIELLSLRVQVTCEPNAIPAMLAELTRADMPVVVESVNLSMPQRGQRQRWEATLVVSTPTLKGGKPL
ncbi:MAG: type II secretion system protein GspM [Planctomycetota bacterium]